MASEGGLPPPPAIELEDWPRQRDSRALSARLSPCRRRGWAGSVAAVGVLGVVPCRSLLWMAGRASPNGICADTGGSRQPMRTGSCRLRCEPVGNGGEAEAFVAAGAGGPPGWHRAHLKLRCLLPAQPEACRHPPLSLGLSEYLRPSARQLRPGRWARPGRAGPGAARRGAETALAAWGLPPVKRLRKEAPFSPPQPHTRAGKNRVLNFFFPSQQQLGFEFGSVSFGCCHRHKAAVRGDKRHKPQMRALVLRSAPASPFLCRTKES